jgi:hypothetical protein
MARLVCAAGVFFDGGLSLGLGTCKELDCDNGDNGVFLIGDDWEIVGRVHHRGSEEVDAAKTRQIADQIIHKIRAADAAANLAEWDL